MSKTYIASLSEARQNAWAEAKALIDVAEAEKRELSAEENEKFNRINADIDAKDEQIRSLVEAEERNAKADELRSRYEGIARPEKVEASDVDFAEFARGLAGSRLEVRDLGKASAGIGGATVPTGFYAQLVAKLEDSVGVLRANPDMIRTESGQDITVPLVTAYTAVAQVAENTAVGSETDPTFSTATLKAYKFMGLTEAGRELVEDAGVDIEAYLARMLGEQVSRGLSKQLIEGDGSTEPQGVFVGFSAAVTAASGDLTMDNLIDLQHAVGDQYRNNGVWIVKDSTLAVVRKLKDQNDNYLWQPSNIAGQPDLLLGKPVVSDAFAPAIGTGNKSVAFGNFEQGYAVRIVRDVVVERSDEVSFKTDQIAFKAVLRADGKVVDSNAVKLLVHA